MSSVDPFNPYAATENSAHDPAGNPSQLSEIANSLAKWQTFFAVLLWIGVAFMAIFFVVTLIGGIAGRGGNVAPVIGMGIGLMVGSIFYILPAVLLWQARSAAVDFAMSPDSSRLSLMLTAQRRFWRIMGILVLVIMAFYGVMLLFALVGMVVGMR